LTAGASTATATEPRRARFPLSTRILIGLALGILAGVFFGEPIAVLQPVADVYIRLMQMTVLPYLVLTLIVGLGQLDGAEARRLALRGGLLFLLFVALAVAVIGLMPLAFPHVENAAFFSHALVEPRQPLALTEIYVPANPFNALANSIVPGVVLFSAALGIALIGVDGKATLLSNLRILERAVVRVTHFVISLTPIGVFAIAAVAAGTMEPATFVRLEVYLLTLGVAAALLSFVVFPLIVSAVTPFRFREVLAATGEAMLTAFIANSVFIVLPMLVERASALLNRHGLGSARADSTINVIIPVAFTFPNAGRLLTLLFVPYVAWLAGDPLAEGSYGTLFGAGVLAYFAKAQVALPFLMDLLGVPHDYFQLYIPASIVTGKFDSMAAAMSLFALALVSAAAVTGFLRWDARRLIGHGLIAVIIVAVALVGTRTLLASSIDTLYRKDRLLTGMHLTRSPVAVIVRDSTRAPAGDPTLGLERIRQRGTLRVGFVRDQLPFAFYNLRGDLVGMDVELAGLLARDLGVPSVEFIAARRQDLTDLLERGVVDVVMTVPYLAELLPRLRYAAPSFEGVIGLVTRDERRHDFASIDDLRRAGRLTIGIAADNLGYEERVRELLPGSEVRFVSLESPQDFFLGRRPEIDAMAMLAEVGSAWSLLYPQYSVTVPQPNPLKVPAGIATRKDDRELAEFIDRWLVLQRSSGAIQQAYNYWVMGQGTEQRRPRWSILRNVLGWNGGKSNAADPNDPR